LLASNASLREEVLGYLAARFGVPHPAFANAQFAESAAGEIWISSDAVGGFRTRRPPGLRALRRTPTGLKPTSAFLVSIGALVASSRVEADVAALRLLALGRRIPCPHADGYVALSYGGDVVGCGLVADGVVHCLVPTGRRQELLDVLTLKEVREAPEV
jgi:hypothetical protein